MIYWDDSLTVAHGFGGRRETFLLAGVGDAFGLANVAGNTTQESGRGVPGCKTRDGRSITAAHA